MLHGNLIFIKKTGGDGSKFPVTEKDVKIGRSENCLIRIYNHEVAPEHCQLMIKDNGQTTLRNFSKHTILNGKPLGQGDVTLCHGDIFKIGGRLVRWEYLPTSKYYRQLLSPSGRLVAVVMPQQRSLDDHSTPGTSSKVSVFKNTPLNKKRQYSETGTSEGSPAVKIRKSSGTDLIPNARGDILKLLTGRNSLKTSKFLLKVKERKSTSGVISLKNPKGKLSGKSRKSTMPSWKVNIVSPPERKSAANRKSLTKSSKKSEKSTKGALKTPAKDMDPKWFQKLSSLSNSLLKTPQKTVADSKPTEELAKSNSKSVQKTSFAGSPPYKGESSVRLMRSSSISPSPRKSSPKKPLKVLWTPKQKSPKLAKMASESKLNSHPRRHSASPKGSKPLSLIFEKSKSTPEQCVIKKLLGNVSEKKGKLSQGIVSDTVSQTNLVKEASPAKGKQIRKSVQRTPGMRSSLRESVKSPAGVKTPRKSVKTPGKQKKQSTPKMDTSKETTAEVMSQTPLLIDLDYTPSPKRVKLTPRKKAKGSPIKKTPGKVIKSVGKSKSPASGGRRTAARGSETISLTSPSPINASPAKLIPASTSPTRRSVVKETPVRKAVSPSKSGVSSPRGVRRKLSPSSSAERAAKMLKTSSPKKPDKNKKAALLVLGKANRKQLISQNVKVLLKQKIVKKAIKQSTLTSQKIEGPKKAAAKVKKMRKSAVTSTKKKKTPAKRSPPKASKVSDSSTIKSPAKDKAQEGAQNKTTVDARQPSPSKVQISVRMSSKGKSVESPVKSPSLQSKKMESPRTITSTKSFVSSVISSPVESYIFNSNRRSKRLSSKNDTGRPDFIELSPTALGLMPKNITVFKTPKDVKRRSSSLVAPKSVRTTGIIKSASTSKIGNRKSVRFSPKDVRDSSEFYTPSVSEKIEMDLSSFQTPDIELDMFVSPLTEKSSTTKKDFSEYNATESMSKSSSSKTRKSGWEPQKCVRKLLMHSPGRALEVSSNQKSLPRSSRSVVSKSPSPAKLSKENKNPINDLNSIGGMNQASRKTKPQRSPRNRLSDLKGVARLLRTPKGSKSPKNDLTDVRGVKKLLQTPKIQKSPKNDLTDVRGVKKLLKTPKVQKSPKNDLTDVKGVKKLMRTPKAQKSPKNDLTDVRGVKKLLRTPKVQKSPKNDLTDVRGVKKLLKTPKVQKSPKNDLTDVKGVKKLMRTPKVQKSPKNDLTDVRGVKKLLRTPKPQKSPKNDLTDLRGVKELLGTPKLQKSPKNDLSDLRGVKKLLSTPKNQKSPKNDLTDVTGVKKLLTTPRVQKSPKNSLLDVSGLGNLFASPLLQKLSKNSTAAMKMLASSPQSGEGRNEKSMNVSLVKQLLISKSPESILKSKKTVSRKSHVKDYRAIRGRRTIYSTPKGPKNDLSDLTGVRELFSRHKPISDYNINLTGVAELFDLPNAETESKPKREKKSEKKPTATVRKPAKKTASPKRRRVEGAEEKSTSRRGRLRKATGEEKEKAGSETMKQAVKSPLKRKAVEKIKTIKAKKPPVVRKKLEKVIKKETKRSGKRSGDGTKASSASEEVKEEIKGSRKRRVAFVEVETPPAKLRRKLPEAEKSTVKAETTNKSASRSRKETVSEQVSANQASKSKAIVSSIQKVGAKGRDKKTPKTKVQSKTTVKTDTKRIQKVQNRSQSSSEKNCPDSKVKASPRKTRSGKIAAASKPTEKKTSKAQARAVGNKTGKSRRTQASPVVKRSTRRK